MALKLWSGDLRKGVDFSDPKLPKMTMTTFDGKPYIEQYTLSKLEILPDFGSEKKAAPTPVRAPFSARRFFWRASAAFCSASLLLAATATEFDTCCRGAQFFGGTPSFQARVLVCSNKVKQFIRSDATDMCIPGTACGGKRMSKGEEQGKPQAREHASVPSA